MLIVSNSVVVNVCHLCWLHYFFCTNALKILHTWNERCVVVWILIRASFITGPDFACRNVERRDKRLNVWPLLPSRWISFMERCANISVLFNGTLCLRTGPVKNQQTAIHALSFEADRHWGKTDRSCPSKAVLVTGPYKAFTFHCHKPRKEHEMKTRFFATTGLPSLEIEVERTKNGDLF